MIAYPYRRFHLDENATVDLDPNPFHSSSSFRLPVYADVAYAFRCLPSSRIQAASVQCHCHLDAWESIVQHAGRLKRWTKVPMKRFTLSSWFHLRSALST